MSITSTCRRTLSIARAVIVAELVFVRGLWCGKRSGAYLVFGQTTSGYLSPMRVMGSQQVVMHDTNHLVESALFRSSKQLDDTTPDSIDNENGFTQVRVQSSPSKNIGMLTCRIEVGLMLSCL
jgi:hypothetical protein